MLPTEKRQESISAFLEKSGWSGIVPDPLAADASTRRYFRLAGDKGRALLMDAPPAAEAATCPPEADPETRRALGYNAMARLAGPRLEAFTSLSGFLREAGVQTPEIYAADPVEGLALIEDFGDRLLVRALAEGGDEGGLYRAALKLLRPLRDQQLSPRRIDMWDLQSYDEVAMLTEAYLLPEWYAPYVGVELSSVAIDEYTEIWRELFAGLSQPQTLVLRDYHAENILVTDKKDLAVIDFQDALIGQAAYDVASLLEDARRDVDAGLAAELLAEEVMHTADPAAFTSDYAILAAQRNAKILGIFGRLIKRDNKPKYTQFLPRVEAHFRRDIGREGLERLLPWVEKYLPGLMSGGKT